MALPRTAALKIAKVIAEGAVFMRTWEEQHEGHHQRFNPSPVFREFRAIAEIEAASSDRHVSIWRQLVSFDETIRGPVARK